VAEYSPFSLDQLEHWGRTIELYPDCSGMIKIEESLRAWVAPRAIDSGIQNVLFADIRSAAELQECISLVRTEWPGKGGTHGVGMRRNVGYVVENGKPAWVDAMDQVVIVALIEKKGAIEDLDAILDTPGLDMVQFGGGDYSVSMGLPQGDPQVEADYHMMIKKALAKGVHPRIELGSLDGAKRYLDMGCRHFCAGWDLTTLYRWSLEQGQLWEELGLGSASNAPQEGYSSK